jgi:hypothetical protein
LAIERPVRVVLAVPELRDAAAFSVPAARPELPATDFAVDTAVLLDSASTPVTEVGNEKGIDPNVADVSVWDSACPSLFM